MTTFPIALITCVLAGTIALPAGCSVKSPSVRPQIPDDLDSTDTKSVAKSDTEQDTARAKTKNAATHELHANFYADGSCAISIDRLPLARQFSTSIQFDENDNAGFMVNISCAEVNGWALHVSIPETTSDTPRRFTTDDTVDMKSPRFSGRLEQDSDLSIKRKSGIHAKATGERFLREGSFTLYQTPAVHIAGAAIHSDRPVFALLSATIDEIDLIEEQENERP